MFGNGFLAMPHVDHIGTVEIWNRHPEQRFLDGAPLDLAFIKKFVCLSLFFSYPIERDVLQQRLEKWTSEYFEFCGRIVHDEQRAYKLEFDPERTWFPLIEQQTMLSAAEAFRRHGRIHGEVQSFPAYLELPFFLEAIRVADMMDGAEPVLKIKLTQYADGGCSVAFTCCNIVADSQRLFEAVADLARLMRGAAAVAPKSHDRSCMWPDHFLEKLKHGWLWPNGDPPRVFDRSYSMSRYDTKQFPEQAIYCELLFFPNEGLEETLQMLNDALDGRRVVTKLQLTMALLWMLRCEMESPRQLNIRELLKDHGCLSISDLKDYAEHAVIPENYFGNSQVCTIVQYKAHEDLFENDDWMHVLLNACVSLNVRMEELHEAANLATTLMNVYICANNQTHVADFPLKIRNVSWWMCPSQPTDCDFGGGAPHFTYVAPPFPFFHYTTALYTDLERNGVFVSLLLIESQREVFINSQVLNHCIPGVRSVFRHEGALAPMAIWE